MIYTRSTSPILFFNEQKKLKADTARVEIPKFIEALNAAIAANPTKTMEEIIVIAAPGKVYGSISSAHRAELYKMAREAYDRKEAFTLTPGEIAEFARGQLELRDATRCPHTHRQY